MIKCPICGRLNKDGSEWCISCGTGLVDKENAVKPKRKKRLRLWIPLGVIVGAFAGLLIIGMLAPSSDNETPSSEPATPASEQTTPSSSSEPVTPIQPLPHPPEQERTSDVREYVEPTNPIVRDTAASVVQDSPDGIDADSEAWKIWQINYWVANNISYVSDPRGHEYFAYADETLVTKAGDCDDFAVLLSSMYESVGLDAAVANIDTDDDKQIDHMTCVVYYSKDSDSFIGEEKIIMNKVGLTSPTGKIHISYFDCVKTKLLSEKYTTGIWIVADPLMADVKDIVGYVIHEPYIAGAVIDVGSK